MERRTVAWCRSCRHYTPAAEIGTPCPATDCTYRLTRRVGYVCPVCSWLWRTRREAEDCGCE
jgi:hypothetical protein